MQPSPPLSTPIENLFGLADLQLNRLVINDNIGYMVYTMLKYTSSLMAMLKSVTIFDNYMTILHSNGNHVLSLHGRRSLISLIARKWLLAATAVASSQMIVERERGKEERKSLA